MTGLLPFLTQNVGLDELIDGRLNPSPSACESQAIPFSCATLPMQSNVFASDGHSEMATHNSSTRLHASSQLAPSAESCQLSPKPPQTPSGAELAEEPDPKRRAANRQGSSVVLQPA